MSGSEVDLEVSWISVVRMVLLVGAVAPSPALYFLMLIATAYHHMTSRNGHGQCEQAQSRPDLNLIKSFSKGAGRMQH